MSESPLEWTAPDKSFTKIVLAKGVGSYSPIDGAVCKVKILVDESGIVPGLDGDGIKELVVGEADSELDCVLEACVSTMKEEETCQMLFSYVPEKTERSAEEVRVSRAEVCEEKIVLDGEDLDAESKIEMDEKSKSVCDGVTTPTEEESESVETEYKEVEKDEDQVATTTDNKLREEKELRESNGEPTDKIRIQLLSFTRQPDIWEMSVTEKWRRSIRHRERGVDLFVEGRFRWAFRRFSWALKYLISVEMDIPSEQLEEDVDLKGGKLICYLNLAACHLKKDNYENVVRCCSKALELDAYHPKALYRRGTALIHLQDYERAQADLDRAAQVDPGNTAIVKQQQLLKKHMQKLNHYYASAMRKMFV